MRPTIGDSCGGVVDDIWFVDLASIAVLRADQLVLPSISLVYVYGVSVIICQMPTFLSYFVKV